MKKYLFLIPLSFILLIAILAIPLASQKDSSHLIQIGERTSTLPILDIYLDDVNGKDIMSESKTENLGGYCVAHDETGKEIGTFKLEQIHSRGHNSFFQEKKGYSLKFFDKVNLYDMGKANKYALLPCYRDTSFLSYLINTRIANELNWGYDLGLTPVHINMNDEYIGLYLLAEKIELDPARVDVLEKGAFIFELADKDYYAEGEPDAESKEMLNIDGERIVLRDYIGITSAQAEQKLTEAYEALKNEDTIWEYWDIDSMSRLLATGFMASEISFDASIYFVYIPSDQKIHALPCWDVEHSYVNLEEFKFYTMQDWYDSLTPCCVIYDYLEHNKELDAQIKTLYKEELRDIIIDVSNSLEPDYFEKYTNDLKMDYKLYGKSDPERIFSIDEKNDDLKDFFEEAIIICDKEWLTD